MTDNLGQSQVIPYVIGLQKKGYQMHILSCEKPSMYEHRRKHIEKLLLKNSIIWHPIPYTSKPAVFSTLYDIKQLQKEALRIVNEYSISFLHCRSYIASVVGLHIQKKCNLPWIFDMRGFWADERVEGNIWKLKNPIYGTIYRYFKQLEKKFISNSSYIISLTHAGKHEIESWNIYKHSKTPITVIPCCADLDHFNYTTISDTDILQVKNELSISKDAFVLSYLGSFGTWYLTKEMFEFFRELLSVKTDAVFLCITPDSKHKIETLAENLNIPRNSLRILHAHRNDVPKYLSISDWSIFFIKPVYSKKASSPTKMAETLGMGIPIICNSGVGDVEEIMNECHTGIVIEEFSADNYRKTISRMFENNLNVNQKQLMDVAQCYYSLEQGIQLYSEVYKKIQ